jgi:uncharacterized membrane protein YfcA
MLQPEILQSVVISPPQLAVACFVAFSASILGGLAGYGTGLILPVFMVPIVGVGNVIPVMAVAMLFNNASRVAVFRREIQWDHVRRILIFGLPACIVGAWCYTLLNTRMIALFLGLFLLASIPLRRLLHRARWQLSAVSESVAGASFGFINGGLPGAGVFLIAILMHAGLVGSAVVATDAIISVCMGLAKIILFGSLAALNAELALTGIFIGLCTVPGAFVARALLKYLSAGIHIGIMEVIVAAGAFTLLWRVF